MKKKLLCLMKIGKREHMYDLIENGTMFLQRLRNYREIEDIERGDRHEGVSQSLQPDKIELRVNGEKIEGIVGPIEYFENGANPLVYCMYGYNSSHSPCHSGNLLDVRCFGFGDTAVIIKNGKKFFDRIIIACEKLNVGVKGKLVEYVDFDNHHGKMGPFRKYKQWFEHQHEFRFVFDNDVLPTDYKFCIGSIHDIAEIHPIKEINSIVKFRY